nr:CrpP-related protein [Achromobacter sp. B7]
MAARRGDSIFSCPFLKAHNMPAHSGQPIHEWQAAVDAWEAGWRSVQDVCRPRLASRVRDDALPIGFRTRERSIEHGADL